MLRKVVSGGQTGADRAGLDFALEVGLEHGGYVPRGRRSEDGRVDEKYHLTELASTSYPVRPDLRGRKPRERRQVQRVNLLRAGLERAF